jgi:integrase
MDEPARPTVRQLCARFRAQHDASRARLTLLDAMLTKACDAFGDVPIDQVEPELVAGWRASMPAPTRWQATQAIKQVGAWAARWELVERDPFARVRNPRVERAEFRPFDDWAQVEAIAAELPGTLTLLPLLGAGCGLRPGELLGLDWRAIDLECGAVHVRASAVDGELRSGLKTRRSRRVVPLRRRLLERLGALDRPAAGLVFATAAGRPLDLRSLRRRAWRPALERAGVAHPHRIYDLRHTYATWSLRAGVGIFQLARRMGTSVEMIDATYGHLALDADSHERDLLDAFDGPSIPLGT